MNLFVSPKVDVQCSLLYNIYLAWLFILNIQQKKILVAKYLLLCSTHITCTYTHIHKNPFQVLHDRCKMSTYVVSVWYFQNSTLSFSLPFEITLLSLLYYVLDSSLLCSSSRGSIQLLLGHFFSTLNAFLPFPPRLILCSLSFQVVCCTVEQFVLKVLQSIEERLEVNIYL